MLQVNEIFGPTIQGEGKSAGKEVCFLRLAKCNLSCVWCDTPYTWDWYKYDKKKEVHCLSDEIIINTIQAIGVKAIVISGGEPMLQQKQLVNLLTRLKELGYWIEVETNGTIPIRTKVMELVDQFNCSPKLQCSRVEVNKRIVPKVLEQLTTCNKANFKFVADSAVDLAEIKYLVRKFKLQEVYLMPEGQNAEDLQRKEKWLKVFCKRNGFHFTQRLHITKLGGGRGV